MSEISKSTKTTIQIKHRYFDLVRESFCKIRCRTIQIKGMLHQGLKIKKLSNFSNFKLVVCELCGISL